MKRRDTAVSSSDFPEQATETVTPNLKPIKVIGNGAFGYVFQCFDQNRNCMVALKRTQKAGTVISREYEILEMLKGATNVVQLLDFFYSKDGKNRLI